MGMEGAGGLVSSLIGAGIKGSVAGAQRKEARRIMQKIGEMPPETIAPELLENKTNAEIESKVGLPSEQYNLAMKNIQRQQMNAIRSAQDRRSAGMLIPAIQGATNNATLQLDAANANARRQNQARLANVNSQIGQRRGQIYNNYLRNYYIPNLNYSRALNGAGFQNSAAAIDQGASGIANFIGGMGGGSGSGGGGSSLGGGLGSMLGG